MVGPAATELYENALAMLNQILDENWLQSRAVVGFWPANSVNDDDILLFSNNGVEEDRNQITGTFHNLRQQGEKGKGIPNLSLTDFIAPVETGVPDYIGGFAVGVFGANQRVKIFEKDHDDYNSILIKALADRFAEATAEWLHEKVRKEFWGYANEENLGSEELIKEKYQGIRPAPGYPACPDHTLKIELFKQLDAQNLVGIKLTESLAMFPAAAVSGMYYAHPQSKYFGLGKIEKDQATDYANRRQISQEEAEKWLSPTLNY